MKKIIACICCLVMIFSTVSVYADSNFEIIELPNGFSSYGTHCFHNGYAPIMTENGWKFIDKNGNIMNWGIAEHSIIWGFSEGLAAIEKDGKIGYIDTNGNLIIGFNQDAWLYRGTAYAGRFIDGKAIAMKNSSNSSFETDWNSIECYYINTKGENIGAVDNDTAYALLVADHGTSYTDNVINVEINGVLYEGLSMDEDATFAIDWETGKMYIVKSKLSSVLNKPIEDYVVSDSEPSDWAAESVTKAAEYNLLNFVDLSNFVQGIDRENFSSLIVNCVLNTFDVSFEEWVKVNNPIMDIFEDIDNGRIGVAHAMGIVNGVGDNKFAPEQKITRQEIAVMIHRAINYIEKEKGIDIIVDNTDLQSFTDANSVADWATTAVGTLANNGIMKGTSETTLSPLDNTTVEQAIVLVLRVFELIK